MEPISIFVTAVAVFAASRVYNYYQYSKQTGYLPGLRSMLTPISALGASFPTSRFNPGLNWQWYWRHQVYERAGTETISAVPYLFGKPAIYTSALEVARQVVSTRGSLYKATDTTEITLLWGPNIFAANGDEWKKHRRIITPAFSPATYESVWKETMRVFDEMVIGEGFSDKSTVEIPVINKLTNKFALILISTCGFGNSLNWQLDGPSTGDMPFGEALAIVSRTHIARLMLPRWVYKLPIKSIQEIEKAYISLRVFMNSLIDSRRGEMASGAMARSDVMSLMIQSNESEGENKLAMSDAELIGNTFLLLSAGHDTTARTLDATLGFLALHPEFQEEAHNEVVEMMPTDEQFTFKNCSTLVKTRASFIEAARLFPPGFIMMRDTAEDIVLRDIGPNRDRQLPVPSGVRLVVDMIGLHYNPRHFPDPEAFKPERWYETHENDLTMFSVGSRACIGRRFALTEGTCFLARLLRDWKVEMLTKPDESKVQWKERVMRGQTIFNFGVGDVPIKLVKRK